MSVALSSPAFHLNAAWLTVLAVACSSPSTSATAEAPASAVPAARTLAPLRPPAGGLPGERLPERPSLDGGTGMADAGPDASPIDASAYGAWQPVRAPPFLPTAGLLLTDGTVMLSDSLAPSRWWRLTPDLHGSYANGTWSPMAQLPTGYAPTFFASAVLPDGRVIIMGGEYNENAAIETPLGAIYDPAADVWTPLEAPAPAASWYAVGDAPSVVLPDGRFMIGAIDGEQDALFDARTLSWTNVGSLGVDGNAGIGKADSTAEEGWTLLPNGKVLTLDVVGDGTNPTQNSELFDPATMEWSSAGTVGVQLSDPTTYEIGPAVLRPDGSVFAVGATGSTAVYGANGHWTPGPTFPSVGGTQLTVADGCAVLLPNGNVLVVAGPGAYQPGAELFEFDGTSLTQVAAPANAANDASYNLFFLDLPNGQILSVDGTADIEVYTPTGAPDPAWAPSLTEAPSTVVRGTTYELQGTQFNGLSQAVAYGDDYQAATNYPIVRITNTQTGHVFYGRTHDPSTMAVATGSATVSTLFEATAATETGLSQLVVVANGIPSAPVSVTMQ